MLIIELLAGLWHTASECFELMSDVSAAIPWEQNIGDDCQK
ncbi:hypothetical protein [Photorhabdus temperata]|nr:hypothetical protein [Photorhabdus temperata]